MKQCLNTNITRILSIASRKTYTHKYTTVHLVNMGIIRIMNYKIQ